MTAMTAKSLLFYLCLIPLRIEASPEDLILRYLKKDNVVQPPFDYVDDIFHCSDPTELEDHGQDAGMSCDPQTFLWEPDSLDPVNMPNQCEGLNFTQADLAKETDDLVEPCLWWQLYYGDLEASYLPSSPPSLSPTSYPTSEFPSLFPTAPAAAPSLVPPTFSPSLSPTAAPSLGVPSPAPSQSAPSAAPSIDLSKLPSRQLSGFVLTLSFPLWRRRRLVSITREVLNWTEWHLQHYLRGALGLEIVDVLLESSISELADEYLLEDVQGQVFFRTNSVLPSTATLDLLIQQAFMGVALDEYLRTLKLQAESPILRSTTDAEVVVDGFDTAGQNSSTSDGENNGSIWTTGFIVILAAGACALLAVFLLAYLICFARSQSRQQRKDMEKQKSLNQVNSQDTPQTKADRFDEEDAPPDDSASDNTSIYSYKVQDDTSVSLAPSFLHAITERSALGAFYDDDSMNAPSYLWNAEEDIVPKDSAPPSTPESVSFIPRDDDEIHAFQSSLRKRQQNNEFSLSGPQSEDGDSILDNNSVLDGLGTLSIGGDSYMVGGGLHSILHVEDEYDEPLQNKAKEQAFSNLWYEGEEKKDDDLLNTSTIV